MVVSTGPLALALSAALLAGLASGCNNQRETPEDALRRFISDVKQHRLQQAWGALSTASKADLEERAKALADAAGDKSERKPERLLVEQLELLVLRSPESISVASRLDKDVVLRVSVEGGESANVHMVREGAGWKVDLMRSLAPPPKLALPARTSSTATTSGP